MITATHVAWFNDSLTCIGIVITHNDKTEESRAFIATVEGDNETSDTVWVSQHGSKFPLGAALIIMKNEGQKLLTPIEIHS